MKLLIFNYLHRYIHWLRVWSFLTVFLLSFVFAQANIIDAKNITISKNFFGNIILKIPSDMPIAPKIRYLGEPARIYLDFNNVEPFELDDGFAQNIEEISELILEETEMGMRMVMVLEEPYILDNFDAISADNQEAYRVDLSFKPVDQIAFDKTLMTLSLDQLYQAPTANSEYNEYNLPMIVIDPGHGGQDPGAIRDGLLEKDITLKAAKILGRVLEESGRYEIGYTREADVFPSLLERRQFAELSSADLFISIHADTVEIGDISGTTIYHFAKEASSANAAKFARFENSAYVFGGAYQDTEYSDIDDVLIDMAMTASVERSEELAKLVQHHFQEINSGPQKSRRGAAEFAVLKAPEFPALLLELGYLSSEYDQMRLQDDEWLEALSRRLLAVLDIEFYNQSSSQ